LSFGPASYLISSYEAIGVLGVVGLGLKVVVVDSDMSGGGAKGGTERGGIDGGNSVVMSWESC
jgi:hypothetical protein